MKLTKLLSAFMLSLALAFPMTAFAQSLDELADDPPVVTESEDALTAYMRDRKPVTAENMDKASVIASPIVNAFGTLAGGIIMVTSAAIFAITAADLAYIGIPPLRSVLNPQYGAGPVGGHNGIGQPSAGICWVSDEARSCVSQVGVAGGAMGMGGMPTSQLPQTTRSVIFTYLRKRSFFMIIFTVCTVLLMSSVLTDCGLNLAALMTKVIIKLTGQIA